MSLDNLKTILNAIKYLLTDYPKKKDIPTKLPNPNPLTFTGAVTGNYDGSEPLTVEIPSGGGGSTVELDTTLSEAGKAADAKAVGDALAGKQDKLIAGDNITIAADGKTISATGGGSDFETVESQLVDIPSKLSQLANDAGYLTLETLPKYDGSVIAE